MTDIEIARKTKKKSIRLIGKNLGISNALEYYGTDKAKIDIKKLPKKENGKLILVTAVSPTPYGEGKTTVSIGLGDAFHRLGDNVVLALREPSMGPVFGLKGGATGGGKSQIVPMEDINLHFTGDFHAITSANNLLCAAIDNHLFQGNELNINPDTICFYRCMDMNDRALRKIQIGLSMKKEVPRSDSFQITAASEIMTIFCLSEDEADLRRRLDQILIGYTYDKKPVYAKDLKVTGAMTVLLKEAMKPNLVQTLEHTPVIVHGGPFANIAHGCNSIIATKTALQLGDYVVTEAGFGSDLGAEKFLDIKCRKAGLSPDAIVLVVTLKALKYNAGVPKEEITKENPQAVKEGLPNLQVHLENMKRYGVPVVVCLNKFQTDTKKEIDVLIDYCEQNQVSLAISTAYKDGGKGAIELATVLKEEMKNHYRFQTLYDENLEIKEKIAILAHDIYRADRVEYTKEAEEQIAQIEKLNRNHLPICVAKTQYSISDDATLLNAPIGNTIHVRSVRLYNGAEFITVLLGNIVTMPGLPKVSAYEAINLDDEGNIEGIF